MGALAALGVFDAAVVADTDGALPSLPVASAAVPVSLLLLALWWP